MKADILGLLMRIDTSIYKLVDWIYDIFQALAGINIFSNKDYNGIVSRIYVVLGMIMLFILAYSLLKAVVNPDEFSKGEKSFPKIIQNVIVSLIIIVVLPSVFTLAFNIQNAFLNKGTIPKLILGENYEETTNDAGKNMSYYVLSAFLHVDEDWCIENGYDYTDNSDINLSSCADVVNGDGSWGTTNGDTMKEVTTNFFAGTGGIGNFATFGESADDGKIEYNLLISTVAGIFLLYVLVNFCFDLAVRVVKLMFFQIIAPVPVVCRILPGGSMKDVFPTWTKKTISTFIEAFIRVAVLYLGVFMIQVVYSNFGNLSLGGLSFTQRIVAKALIIMGIVVFIKQAPKLIADMFHIDSGSMKLGIMDKLAMGGGLIAGAVAGGAITGFGRNAIGNYQKSRSAGKGRFASVLSGTKSGIAGGASAGLHAGWAGRNAKNAKDMKSAVATGTSISAKNKATRDYYKAMPGSAIGHRFMDKMESVGEYFGINSVQDLMDENKLIDKIASDKKAVRTSVESVLDSEANKSSSKFAYAGYSATELRQKMLDIQSARAGQLKDINGKIITAAQAQQEYDDYRYNFSQAMQNIVLSQRDFEQLGKVDKGMQAKMYEAYSQAEVLKDTLSKNLDKDYVKQAGFTAANVKGDLKVDTSGPLKDIGDILDVQKSKNNTEIARRTREKQEKNSKNQ